MILTDSFHGLDQRFFLHYLLYLSTVQRLLYQSAPVRLYCLLISLVVFCVMSCNPTTEYWFSCFNATILCMRLSSINKRKWFDLIRFDCAYTQANATNGLVDGHVYCISGSMSVSKLFNTRLLWSVGGVAQWLGRPWLAGGLSLIYAWSMVDKWLPRGQGIRSGSANQVNSASHPFGVGKWVAIHVITWITGVETIKRQTMGCACGCLAVRLQARVCGLSLQPVGCTSALSVAYSAAAAAVTACGAI